MKTGPQNDVGASKMVLQEPKSFRWQIWEFRRYAENKKLTVRKAPECAWVARHWWSAASGFQLSNSCCNDDPADIANLQKMAVADRREAEPKTGHRNDVRLAVRQASIELL